MSAAPLNVNPAALLDAAGKLPPAELDAFVEQVVRLRAEKVAPSLGPEESELLQRINAALPEADQQRYRELKDRRDAESLTPGEHAELLRLSGRVEEMNAARITALAELARLRRTSLIGLMDKLGIPSTSDE